MKTSIVFTESSWSGGDFDQELLESRSGILIFRVSGKGADKAFANEAGGHRWQRNSPTEKRDRRHTSTITVAVLPESEKIRVNIDEDDLEWKFARGSGPGGQHRNKTDTAVQLTHKPTKISVRIDGRSQLSNKEKAFELLKERIFEHKNRISSKFRENARKDQVGSGMRGDKVRTICVHKGLVFDHTTGKKIPFKRYERGDFDEFTR